MTTHYTLFDINTTNTKIWSKRLGKKYPLDVICDAVNNITADVYVSPANGACQLDGGIDKVYRAMFPGIQPIVNKALSIYKGRSPLLGVGSCLMVDVPNRETKLLLTPTMDLPSRLKTPWNSLWSALAIFYVTKDLGGTVAIPGLGTGTGHIDPEEMIEMVMLARRISQEIPIEQVYPVYEYIPGDCLILPQSLHETPPPENICQLIKTLS